MSFQCSITYIYLENIDYHKKFLKVLTIVIGSIIQIFIEAV